MVVIHPDNDFLDDITGKLKEYVLEELNLRSVTACNDPLKYASLRAEPDFSSKFEPVNQKYSFVGSPYRKLKFSSPFNHTVLQRKRALEYEEECGSYFRALDALRSSYEGTLYKGINWFSLTAM